MLLVCASRTSRLGAASPAPRRCTSRARSTSTRRYIEQGERRTASLVHRAVVRTSRSSLRQRSSSRVVKLGLRSFIRTRFVVLIVGTLIVRSVTPRRSRTPSHSRSDSAWSASLQGATSTTSSLIMRSSWLKILAVSSLCVLHYLQGAQRPPGVVQREGLGVPCDVLFKLATRTMRSARARGHGHAHQMKSPLRSSWVYPCSHVVIMSWPCRQVFTTGMSCGIQGIIAACESWSWSPSWFGMGSDGRTTHDVGMHAHHAHIKSS